MPKGTWCSLCSFLRETNVPTARSVASTTFVPLLVVVRLASREELLRLFQATESLYYDETPLLRSRLTDLDERAFADLLETIKGYGFDTAGIPRERLLRSDYTIAAPVRALVFDDRVEVRTPGQLPNSVTLEALRLGVHVLRNPTMYNSS